MSVTEKGAKPAKEVVINQLIAERQELVDLCSQLHWH